MKHEHLSIWASVCTAGGLLLVTPSVQAQEDESEEQSIAEVTAEADEASDTADAAESTDNADKSSPVEEEGVTYYFAGLRYRGIVMPQFLLANFLDGAESQYFGGIGPEFTIRKNGVDINLSVWFSDYSMDETRVKGAGDPDYAWSSVKSTLKFWYATIELTGSTELKPQLAWYYGGGAGLALVFGDVIRNELTPPFGNPGAPVNQWSYCPAAGGDPLYCSGETPPNYSEPSWFNGGSKPPLFPWLGVQTGLRFKPHRRFVSRAELGLTLTGIFFSLAADYGL